jgi:hypothetical protein
MQDWKEAVDFETLLEGERHRLVRLCAWFAHDPNAAEDLAQAAWKNREQLTSLDKLKPWTSSIARNICLNWSRRRYREQSRLVFSMDAEEVQENEPADDSTRDSDRPERPRRHRVVSHGRPLEFGGMMIDPLGAAYVVDVVKAGANVFGLLVAVQAVGGILGGLLAGKVGERMATARLYG